MVSFLHGKGQILWDVMVDIGYVQPMNFLAPGSRDMFDANNKAVDNLFRALCQSEFDRVHTENLACRIWTMLIVNFHQPSHEFTFSVGLNFISYPLVLTPLV
jgi:hypothetical protein